MSNSDPVTIIPLILMIGNERILCEFRTFVPAAVISIFFRQP